MKASADSINQTSSKIAIIFMPSPGVVKVAGDAVMKRAIEKHWALIEQEPGFMDDTQTKKKKVHDVPEKPISDMLIPELRKFTSALLTHDLGSHHKGFGDPAKKPVWFPSELDWIKKRFTKRNKDEENFLRPELEAIVYAYFNHNNIELPTNTTVCNLYPLMTSCNLYLIIRWSQF